MSQQLGPFFTLTQLQEFLDLSDRRKLRDHLLPRGAPCMTLGRETVFEMETFTEWIRERINAGRHAAAPGEVEAV